MRSCAPGKRTCACPLARSADLSILFPRCSISTLCVPARTRRTPQHSECASVRARSHAAPVGALRKRL
eukprot:4632540-Pyramimonas_sp.AAC.1